MKILLTGADGFIGKNFLEKYSDKYEIFAPTSEELELGDIRKVAAYFEGKSFDAVVHAAENNENTLVEFKNVQYESVLHGVKKLIVVSDACDIDTGAPLENAGESTFSARMPKSETGVARHVITTLASKDKISTVLRFFGVYGKYLSVEKSKIMELMARGVTGKKTAVVERDLEFSAICIDDALKVITAFLDGDIVRGAYNVASDAPLKLSSVARTARRLAAKDGREVTVEILSDESAPNFTASVGKLKAAMPKLRFTAHSTALKAVYEHLKRHKSEARPKSQGVS